MRYWLLWSCLIGIVFPLTAQDSVQVIIHLDAANDQIELSSGYQEARSNLDVLINMYNLQRGVKTLAKTYRMRYSNEEEAWVATVPWGFYELNIHSLGFKDINHPMRLKSDYREEFALDVDSTSYTYENGKRYDYILGTRHFNSTVVVRFKDEGEPADYRAFLQEALALEELPHINVLRVQKMRNTNTFLVNIEVIAQIPLNLLLYRKVTQQKTIEPGYLIGGGLTQAIELFQANPAVVYANPTFIDDSTQELLPSAQMAKSSQLERKLLRLMENDPATLDKINYIIQQTPPPEPSNE